MSSNKKAILEINLGENGHMTFRSHDQIRAWVDNERDFWKWVTQGRDNAINQAIQAINGQLNNIRTLNEGCISAEGGPNYDASLQALQSTFGNLSNLNNFITSSNPKAIFVDNLRVDQGELVAGYCLALLMQKGISATNPQAIRGSIEAVLFERGIKRSVRPERKALETLRKEFSETLADFESESIRLNDEIAASQEAFENMRQKKEDEFKKLVEDSKEEKSDFLEASKEEWKNIKAAFIEHMTLEAPVDYWLNQQKKHAWKAWSLVVTAILGFIGAGVGLYRLADWLLLGEPGRWKDFPGVTLLGLPLWHIVILMIFGSLIAWALRVLVRLMLSEIHLATDAGERVVMAKTYQALIKDGHGPAESDRTLILQTLFRPAATGVLNEDSAPVMPLELVMTLLKRG